MIDILDKQTKSKLCNGKKIQKVLEQFFSKHRNINFCMMQKYKHICQIYEINEAKWSHDLKYVFRSCQMTAVIFNAKKGIKVNAVLEWGKKMKIR